MIDGWMMDMILTQGSWPPKQWKLTRGQTRNSGEASLGPLLQNGEQEQNQVPLFAHQVGGTLVPYVG